MQLNRRMKECGGVGLLALGVLGIVLPILPGIPFLIAGAAVLGATHPLIRPFRQRLDRWRHKADSTDPGHPPTDEI